MPANRFASILAQLPIGTRQLSIGCGAFEESACLPDCIGIDVEAGCGHVQADGRWLPFACPFDLTIIRHPDVARNPAAWGSILQAYPGLLLVTLYSPDEVDFVRQHVSRRRYPISERRLAPVDATGRDKFVLVFQ
jgi:hypothetical protein